MDETNVVIDAFTELSSTYEESVDYELRLFWGVGYYEFMDRLLKMIDIREGDVVLDIATGTAVIPLKLVDEFDSKITIVGLDITPSMLAKAQKKIREKNLARSPLLICGSGMEMPVQDHVFDVIICGLGTHHMNVKRLMSEVKRVLKPGGTFIMADVRATSFWRSPLGLVLLKGLITFYGWKLRWSAARNKGKGIQAQGLNMSDTRAEAELEAFKNVLTTDEWKQLVQSLGFRTSDVREIAALRRIYPGGLILKAVADGS